VQAHEGRWAELGRRFRSTKPAPCLKQYGAWLHDCAGVATEFGYGSDLTHAIHESAELYDLAAMSSSDRPPDCEGCDSVVKLALSWEDEARRKSAREVLELTLNFVLRSKARAVAEHAADGALALGAGGRRLGFTTENEPVPQRLRASVG
jgi:hypothetical protein